MDQSTFHIFVTVLNLIGLGLVYTLGYLMKTSIETNKQRVDHMEQALAEQAKDIVEVKVHYLQKDDFSEFKNELWRKLEDIKEIVKHNA